MPIVWFSKLWSILSDRGDAIDATTVRTILDNQGDLQNIGGLSYLVEIVNSVPTSANAEYYAKIVAEKAMLRRLIAKLTESVNQAYEASQPADEIIAQAEKGLIDVSENANRSGFKNIRDVLNVNFGIWRLALNKRPILQVLRQAIVI